MQTGLAHSSAKKSPHAYIFFVFVTCYITSDPLLSLSFSVSSVVGDLLRILFKFSSVGQSGSGLAGDLPSSSQERSVIHEYLSVENVC